MILEIQTPALLFSATSLILLAYTNRFLTIAQIVRGLKKTYDIEHRKNLNLRISLIRYMQLFGVLCLFLSVFAMLVLFLELQFVGIILFAASMLSLLLSLALSFWEISISVTALRLHLSDIKEEKKGNVKTVEEKTTN
jgi:Zn-dependent membrane protease YugP